MKEKVKRMIKTKEQIKDRFSKHCNRCIDIAMEEYLHRASHKQLSELKDQVDLLLEAPCKTDVCQEKCRITGNKS